MGAWLQASALLNRPVHTLSITDLDGMATAVLSRWIVLRREREIMSPTWKSPTQPYIQGFKPMIDMSKYEAAAVKETRQVFAKVITQAGLMPAFFNCTPATIDNLIRAAASGYQNSINRQCDGIGNCGTSFNQKDFDAIAYKDARKPFAESLTEAGLMPAFFNCTVEVIDHIVRSTVREYNDRLNCKMPMEDDMIPF